MAKKIVNSDIYNIAELVNDVKREYLPEETDETLNASTYGYIGAIETKRLQTQVIMSGELANEAFESRARLERSVITHAVTNNIKDINAVPAKMDVIIGIRENDLLNAISNNVFVLDRECPIYLSDFEFHLEYDVIIKRITISGNDRVYTAQYDMRRENPSSTISNPYISAPATMIIEKDRYIFINVIISQVAHNYQYKKTTTSNIIDNKTINFEFEDQLAYFEVHVTEPDDEKYLTPVFEGSGIPEDVILYCWYQYIDTNTIRVRFDRNSYMPGLNCQIELQIKTTKGEKGNFTYREDLYINFESEKYGYKNLSVLVKPASDSDHGKNRKTKKELQRLIPKEKLSRGSLTNIKDLNNYFGMIDSDYGRIIIQKKIDNQRERVYYAYLVLKDSNGNIVPSNTIDLKIPMSMLLKTETSVAASPRYVLKSGSCFRLSEDKTTATVVNTPIPNTSLEWHLPDIPENQKLIFDFQGRITSEEFRELNARLAFNNNYTSYVSTPTRQMNIISKYLLDVKMVNNRMVITKSNGETITIPVDVNDPSVLAKDDILINHSSWTRDNTKGVYTVTVPLNRSITRDQMKYVDGYIFSDPSDGVTVEKTREFKIFASSMTYESITFETGVDIIPNSDIKFICRYIPISTEHILPNMSYTYTDHIIDAADRIMLSVEDNLRFVARINTTSRDNIEFTCELPDGFTYTDKVNNVNQAIIIVNNTETPILNSGDSKHLKFIVENPLSNKEYSLKFKVKVNERYKPLMSQTIHIKQGTNESDVSYNNMIGIELSIPNNPEEILEGNIINYHFEYTPTTRSPIPIIKAELSRGVQYVAGSGTIKIGNNDSYTSDPIINDLSDDIGFLYTNPYTIAINSYHLYSSFYMMCINANPYVHFEYINDRSAVQFISTNVSWIREFLGYNRDKYTMRLQLTQSINTDLGLIVEHDPDISHTDKWYEYKAKVIAVFYRNNRPYRYKNLEINNVDDKTYTFSFMCQMRADDILDKDNNIRVSDVGVVGQTDEDYGFFNPTTDVKIYALAKVPNNDGTYTRHDLDSIVPGLDGWIVTNVYKVVNGLSFYINYADIMGSRVTPYGMSFTGPNNIRTLSTEGYYIKNVPVFGYDYSQDETLINNAINALNDRKLYIDEAIIREENSFGIDFKNFNTYGPSKIFYIIKDSNSNNILDDDRIFIDRVNITMKFRVKLRALNDQYTRNSIIKDIKDYMEDLNELGEVHIPNLTTYISNTYSESITYFEFLGINDYGAGVQHLYKLDDRDIPIHVCPEFININNYRATNSSDLQPDITIFLSEN